jgi:NAD-dependent DNA ligase
MDDDYSLHNKLGNERISARQIDELIGLARGIAADGVISDSEVRYLQKWLTGSVHITNQPVIQTLLERVNAILHDDIIDDDEKADLFDTLQAFSNREFELGELLKATTLPLCSPAPNLSFTGSSYCFTGTFNYGRRKACEEAATVRGAMVGPLSQKTNVLVIGVYATDSWKHSSFGTKILKAVEFRQKGVPICIVSEEHWTKHL